MVYVARFWLAWFLRKTSMMKNNNNKPINKANCTLKETKERSGINRKVWLTSDSETKLLRKPRRLSVIKGFHFSRAVPVNAVQQKRPGLKQVPGTRMFKDHAAVIIGKHWPPRAD